MFIAALAAALIQTAPPRQRRVRPVVCPAENGLWLFPADDSVSMKFEKTAMDGTDSDLVLRVHTSMRDYWFAQKIPDPDDDYPGLMLEPISDPHAQGGPHLLLTHADKDEYEKDILRNLHFYMMTNDRSTDRPIRAGREAPQRIFAPELGYTLWNDPHMVTGDIKAERDFMPRGEFVLQPGCGGTVPTAPGAPPANAPPANAPGARAAAPGQAAPVAPAGG